MATHQHPVVYLRPSGRFTRLNLRDLHEYRDLLYFLVWRDVKVRYKQTVLGAAWAILQPLLTMVAFSIFIWTPGEGPLGRHPLSGFRLRRPASVDAFRLLDDGGR